MRFFHHQSGTNLRYENDVELEVGKVYHVVISWNGGQATTDCTIKVNGAGVTARGSESGSLSSEGDTSIEVARDKASSFFDGWLRDIALWAGPLSVSDWAALFNDPRGESTGGINPANQLVRLRLEDKVAGQTLGSNDVSDSWGSLPLGDGVATPTQDEEVYFPVA